MDFGNYLIDLGLITDEQLRRCERFHRDQFQARIGRLAIAEGKMSPYDVTLALGRQKFTGERFGEAAVKLGLLKAKDFISLLRTQRPEPRMLGECLVKLKLLDRMQTEDALTSYLERQTKSQSERQSAKALVF